MRLIDAGALIAEMHNVILEDGEDRSTFYAVIERQPTIDPVKHGRWSREHLPSTSGGTYEVWRCSECQSAFNWRMRYCGYCGARMEGEEDE